MSRYAPAVVDAPEWVSVSPGRPCSVCGAIGQCSVLEDGEFACCLEVVSDRPVLTGGWLHRLSEVDSPRFV